MSENGYVICVRMDVLYVQEWENGCVICPRMARMDVLYVREWREWMCYMSGNGENERLNPIRILETNMADTDDDEMYVDAISTADPHQDDKYATAKFEQGSVQTSAQTENCTEKGDKANPSTSHDEMRSSLPQSGKVANLINRFKGQDYQGNVQSNEEISAISSTLRGDVSEGNNSSLTYVPNTVDNTGTYSFAKDVHLENDNNISGHETADYDPNVDLFGYSHAMKEAQGPCLAHQPRDGINADMHSAGTGLASCYPQENLYDSVKRTSDGFEIIDHIHIPGSSMDGRIGSMDSRSSKTGEKEMLKKMVESLNHEWKRKEAKKKSKTMKRPSKPDKGGNPFTQHSELDDPHDGAIPEAEDESLGHVFSPFTQHSSHHDDDDGHHDNNDDADSCSSIYTDSTFDTMSSDSDNLFDEDYLPNKPLPPKPEKQSQLKDLKQKVLPGHNKKESVDECRILEPVMLRRRRTPPSLPVNEGSISQNQVKLRGVLQSLIDSETNYIKSLERLKNVYKETILSLTKKAEVKVTFQKVEEIVSIHQMFQIEFSDKLKNWNADEKIGTIFHVFSQRMVVNIYSDYVNNYEAASETIKDLENSKQTFKEFLKKKQMESDDRLSLAGLMLKPVQRFPQFIMIIKDLLKYTPRDHHDREQLQEAVTWIENVAHQLNERKRQSEQFYHGNQIMSKLPPRGHVEKNLFLIRQDDMEQHSQDQNGSQFIKLRRIFLMNDRLVSVHVPQRDGVDRYVYKWHQSLQNLELNTSAVTPNMQTKINIGETHTSIMSPKSDGQNEDPYNIASDLTDMMHDISVLAKIHHLTSALKLSHQGLSDDHIQSLMVKLQMEIQGKDYQLQMLNSNTIILQDKVRHKKYVFSASNAKVKQEWCIDFLMAKYSQDVVNIPSWHKSESSDSNQPALLMKHMSVDMQRTFTKLTCGVKVYFPRKNSGSEEHLWICSSNEGQGQVSIVSLHTHKPSLIESFQATKCEILCAETVPGFATVANEKAFQDDTVWMSTADSVIEVFMLSENQSDGHRRSIYTFNIGCMILCIKSIDDCVLCGNRSGTLIIFSRDDDGIWNECKRLSLGVQPITSIINVGDVAWVVCGSHIYIIDIDHFEIQGTVDHQLTTEKGESKSFQYLVKTGVGVWASFIGQPNICLYHCESKRLLQDFNICSAINEFVKVYTDTEEKKTYLVTCLMVSLGMLWVGTNDGIILVYPLPRLRDGVPRINERPQVALHSHRGPVKFLIPVHYGPITGTPIRRRPASVLKNYKIDDSIIQTLAQVDAKTPSGSGGSDTPKYLTLRGDSLSSETFYEEVKFQGYQGNGIYEEIGNLRTGTENVAERANDGLEKCDIATNEVGQLNDSGEHTYFMLEPHTKENSDKTEKTPEVKAASDDKKEDGSDNTASAVDNIGKIDPDKKLINELETVSLRQKPEGMSIRLRNRESNVSSFTMSLPNSNAIPLPVNLQTELQDKLKKRKSMDDLTDRDATKEDVDILYPTLLRSGEELPYFRPRMSSAIKAKKPDFSASRRSKKESSTSPEQGNSNSFLKRKGRSVSFNKGTEPEKKPQKSRVGSSFTPGSSIDTLSRQDTNTILVLSGGNGYKDWKKRQGSLSYRHEEPCVLFWMYRF
ncbi:guanine nucleotide exchange factor 10-like protein [Mactra antiquata]